MAESTKIEWADHTFNPWEGCQKVGPGCDNCYAENRNARFAGGQAINWGPGAPRRRTSASNWNKPLAWNKNADAFMAAHGRRQRVFCASLADVFDNAVDPRWRADLFALILATPALDWLLLTKRIGNVVPMLAELRHGNDPDLPVLDMMPLPNVWIGVTIVNQEEADRDITKLIEVPAAKRFLSVEPMLGELDIMKWLQPYTCADCGHHGSVNDCGPDGCKKCSEEAAFDSGYTCKACGADDQSARASCPNCGSHRSYEEDNGFIWSSEQRLIDWVICGGESGPGARPMSPDWARCLRDQCQAAGTPFLFKQWGEWLPDNQNPAIAGPSGDTQGIRVGKKAAGRLLDSRTWDEFPAL
ncbi:phage Gp37/Gp68 family protein [Alicycliphilus denitrificans]|uniref:phage Gp37/Gp68 family protein n=1 Tax=Alicycliphilus denitrificans TaxID=179636 RepID=UPI000C9F7586|nr:DUF5131 family protein [Alicycliphilus denitrificans]